MESIDASTWLIAFIFFGVALTYSAVGLGGGSSYTALMAIFGFSYLTIPMVTLSLNLMVTSMGSFNYFRRGHVRLRLIVPFLVSSVPMAYLGGTLNLPKEVFYWLLWISLVGVVIRIYVLKEVGVELHLRPNAQLALALLIGAILGLLAGIVGIGGGVYLIPLILILKMGDAKQAAATGSLFIWFNSAIGLSARIQHNPIDFTPFLPMLAAVTFGGIIGSNLGSGVLSRQFMQKLLGLIILVAIGFLTRKIFMIYS